MLKEKQGREGEERKRWSVWRIGAPRTVGWEGEERQEKGEGSESSLETDQEAADGQLAAAACGPVRGKQNWQNKCEKKEGMEEQEKKKATKSF
jgi:hypothetical protein